VRARKGDAVQVESLDGRTHAYRVTNVRRVRKANLPASLFTRKGSPRLELVTCGGPFRDGHYRDNVIVTAVPR
jgi:sortase (surface protein transpeptidase)